MKYTVILVTFLVMNSVIWGQKNKLPQTFFLSQKPYYEKIFSKNEISEIEKGFGRRQKAEKFLNKYNYFKGIADDYRKKANLPGKKSSKYKKKAAKYDLKATKYAQKGYNRIFDGSQIIKTRYTSKLNSYKPDSSNKFIITILRNEQKRYQDSLNIINTKISKTQNQLALVKFYAHKQKYLDRFLLLQEYQLAVYQQDSAIIKALQPKKKPNNQNNNQNNNQQQNNNNQNNQNAGNNQNQPPRPEFNPLKDSHLYSPKYADLDAKINYTEKENVFLQSYYNSGKNGFYKFLDAQKIDDSINNLTKQVAKESDFMKRGKLNDKIRELTSTKNYYLISAFEKYLTANKAYYDARSSHIKDIKAPEKKQKMVDSMFKMADLYYKSSQYIIQHPDTVSKNKIEAFNIANRQLINACQYQENGLAIQRGYAAYAVNADTNLVVLKSKPEGKKNGKQKTEDKDKQKTGKQNKTNKTNKTNKPTKCLITGLYVYSYENPKPHQTLTPMGTIYRVQVGVSKYLLPVNELKDYGQIYYETLSCSSYKRFLVGDYSDLEQAQEALRVLKSRGYNAKIVKYVDGRRQGAVYAAVPKTQTKTKPVESTKYNAIDVSQTKYLKYFIQIGTFSTPKTQEQLKVGGQLYFRLLSDGRVQYFTGPYYRYSKAKEKLAAVKQIGYTDAIIVAFNNGKEITLAKAKQIENNVSASEKVIYRVQIGAFSDFLSKEQFNKKFGQVADLYKIHTHTNSKGLIVYSAGDATTIQEARKIRQVLASMGFEDAFIIAFKGGKQVPLSSVNK